MFEAFKTVFTNIHFLGAFFQTVIIILIGFFFRRFNLVGSEAKKVLTVIIWKVSVPCFAFNAFMQDFNLTNFKSTIKEFVFAIIFYTILILIGKLIFAKKGKFFSTLCGLFMAIGQVTLFSMPILNSIYETEPNGEQVMLYISTISIVFRIFVYIIGFYLISGEEIHFSTLGKNLKKIFITPIMIGMFAGILVFLIQNATPQVQVGEQTYSFLRIDKTLPALYVTIRSLANLLSPLSMFLIGTTIGEAHFKEAFKDITSWIVAILRNFVAPIFVILICLLLHKIGIANFNEYSLVALVIGFSAPVSVTLSVMCTQYQKEEAFASRTCFVSTLLTIISLPLMFVLCQVALNFMQP